MRQPIIEKITKLCSNGAFQWTIHVVTRLLQWSITQDSVKLVLMRGKIIEEYLDDYPYPS